MLPMPIRMVMTELTLGHYQGTLVLDAGTAVNITAASEILVRNSVTVGNSTSTGAWTLTAPTVQMNDNSGLNTTGELGAGGNGANLTIHTNNLNLGDGGSSQSVSVVGNNVTVDDATLTAGGVALNGAGSTQEYLTAIGGQVNVNATNGSILVNGNFSSQESTMYLNAQTNIVEQSGTLSGYGVALSAGGSVGGSSLASYIQTAALHLAASAPNGAAYINQTGASTLLGGFALTAFDLTTNANTGLDNIAVGNGSISVIESAGTLTVNVGTQMTANAGNVLLENSNTGAGAIAIDANARIQAYTTGAGSGQVAIVIGGLTTNTSTKPANVTQTTSGGGQIFYGQHGITASAPTNYVNANSANVIFQHRSITQYGNFPWW